MIKLLVVDDSALMRRVFGEIFEREDDFELAFAKDGLEALEKARTFRPHVATLDVQMPRLDGLACLDRLMLEHPCPVVMVSALTTAGADAALEALALGAVDFVAKPEGAVTLAIDELAPGLVAKVRQAAASPPPRSHRLRERVRARYALRLQPATVSDAPAPWRPTSAGEPPGLVIIGTSTGGPQALDAVLPALPADFPWPVVVAQHMPALFTESLARRLDGVCPLRVIEVVRPTPLAPGAIYIARGGADMTVSLRKGGPVVLSTPQDAQYRWHPSVDRLVTSAAAALPPASLIGVLMTGMGNDGARAMADLRRAGGRTIAEAEETAVVWGMPGELVKADGADVVTPIDSIAAQICAMVRQ
ncbi:MAG: chemotaxis-specific protein-glutamate methyltransferase CheB [Caulobacteraceae bacterium]